MSRAHVVNRPVSPGGRGYHVAGDRCATVPHLCRLLPERLAGAELPPAPVRWQV